MIQRKILGAANGFEQKFAEWNGNADLRDNVFFERAEKVKAAGRIVEDRRGDLRQLALHPENDLIDAEDAHFRDCGAKALAGLDQLGGFLKLALGEGAFAQHHFAEAVLAVAAGGEDELAAVKKELALDASEDELELAGEARGIDFVEQREKLAGFVAEIERVDMEAREIASERRGIYKSAKEQGFDTKAIKAVIAARRVEKTKRESLQNTIDAYMHALGMLADTPLGQAAMSREFADPPFAAPHDEARRV